MVPPVCPIHSTGGKHRVGTHNYKKPPKNQKQIQNRNFISYEPRGHSQRAQHCFLPSLWIHYDGIRLVYHARDEGLAMLARHLSHFNDIPTRVGPVQVPSYPVHRYTTRHLQLFDLYMRTESFLIVFMCLWKYYKETFLTHTYFSSITCRLVTLPSLCRRLRWELEEADDVDCPRSS